MEPSVHGYRGRFHSVFLLRDIGIMIIWKVKLVIGIRREKNKRSDCRYTFLLVHDII